MENKNDNESKLMKFNNLHYAVQPAVSVTTERKVVRYQAERGQYNAGESVVIRINSGSQYVDTKNSWLSFDVEADAAATLSARGSACDLIREIVFKTRTGKEIFRNQQFNVYARNSLNWKHSEEWKKSVGSAFGMHSADDVSTKTRYSIPLSVLSDLFANGKRLPPFLMAGAELEIVLEQSVTGLTWAGAAGAVTVSNVQLQCDCYTLTDAVERKLMQEASQDGGLKLQFTAYHNQRVNVGASTNSAEVNAQKSVARACGLFGVTRDSAAVSDSTADSLAPEAFDYVEVRTRLGSLNFPDLPLTESSDFYVYALRAWKKLSEHGHSSTNVGRGDYAASDGQFNAILERDETMINSGLPTDRSQGDVITSIRYGSASARTIDMFLCYEREVEVGLQSTITSS